MTMNLILFFSSSVFFFPFFVKYSTHSISIYRTIKHTSIHKPFSCLLPLEAVEWVKQLMMKIEIRKRKTGKMCVFLLLTEWTSGVDRERQEEMKWITYFLVNIYMTCAKKRKNDDDDKNEVICVVIFSHSFFSLHLRLLLRFGEKEEAKKKKNLLESCFQCVGTLLYFGSYSSHRIISICLLLNSFYRNCNDFWFRL